MAAGRGHSRGARGIAALILFAVASSCGADGTSAADAGGDGGAALTESDCQDSDRDGLDDAEESVRGTDPAVADSDADGFDDGDEALRGSDPTDPISFPAAYDGLSVYAGDTHVHAGTAVEVYLTSLPAYGPDYCDRASLIGSGSPHSLSWCQHVYDRARDAGLDWVNLSHHGLGVLDATPDSSVIHDTVVGFWTDPANADYRDPQFGDDPHYQYPTHPDGFPLWTEPGHTGSEWLFCAARFCATGRG